MGRVPTDHLRGYLGLSRLGQAMGELRSFSKWSRLESRVEPTIMRPDDGSNTDY